MTEVKQYAERDLMGMDEEGNHYCRHISAMTREGLNSKSDIAAELGWRDMQIADLKQKLDALAAENVMFKSVLEKTKHVVEDIWLMLALSGYVENPDGRDQDRLLYNAAMAKKLIFETPATDAYLNAVRAEGAISVRNALLLSDDGSDIYAVATEVIAQLRSGAPKGDSE